MYACSMLSHRWKYIFGHAPQCHYVTENIKNLNLSSLVPILKKSLSIILVRLICDKLVL